MTTKTLDRTLLERLSLIGRKKELERIDKIAKEVKKSRQPAVIYIEGEGGIGKTALLEEARKRLSKQWGSPPVAGDIIDLYHLQYQTPQGFAKEIIRLLGEEARPYFEAYRQRIEKLNQQISAGGTVTKEERMEVWELFTQALSGYANAQAGPTVLFLDTLEVLSTTHDDFQREMGNLLASNLLISMLDDLVEHFFALQGPILWIVSGRPREEIRSQLQRMPSYQYIKLGPLSEEEGRAYLNTIAERLEGEAQEKLRYALEEAGDRLIRGAGGRPIMLTLIAYIAAAGLSFPEDFGEKEQDQRAVEKTILERLIRIPGWGGTLRLMGMLRKGLDLELLRELKGLDESDANKLLKEIKDLVIVKEHAVADAEGQEPRKVYFLHDEIYAMFDRHLPYLPPKKDRQAYIERLYRVYADRERKIRRAARNAPSERRTILRTQRINLQAERLHYQILDNPLEGFSEFFLRSEDALDGRDRELFFLLHATLLQAREILRVRKQLSSPPATTGRSLSDIIGSNASDRCVSYPLNLWIDYDLALRWSRYLLFVESDAQRARTLLEKAHFWQGRDATLINPLIKAQYKFYQALILLRAGEDTQKVHKTLQDVLQVVSDEFPASSECPKITELLRAYVVGYLGYLERLKGKYYRAIPYYQEAVQKFRKFKLSTLTTTLANLAYAMTMVGWFRRARQNLDEALHLAERRGKSYELAVILNVASILEAQDSNYAEGIEYGEEALKILEDNKLEAHFLRAHIHTNLARAYRYAWNRKVSQERWHEKLSWQDTLWKAYKHINRALMLISEQPFLSPYLVERWGERGCVAREMAWLYRKWQNMQRVLTVVTLTEKEMEAFQQSNEQADHYLMAAAGVMSAPEDKPPVDLPEGLEIWKERGQRRIEKLGGDPYLPTLALTNLGWHWHYQRKGKERLQAIYEVVYALIPEDYHLPEPERKRKQAHIMLWSVLGKVEMLLFHSALREWSALRREDEHSQAKRQEREKIIENNIKHVIYALEYVHMMGEDPYDLRRAEEGLNNLLLGIEGWEDELLPQLRKYGQKFVESHRRQYSYWRNYVGPVTFTQWLDERFGSLTGEEDDDYA